MPLSTTAGRARSMEGPQRESKRASSTAHCASSHLRRSVSSLDPPQTSHPPHQEFKQKQKKVLKFEQSGQGVPLTVSSYRGCAKRSRASSTAGSRVHRHEPASTGQPAPVPYKSPHRVLRIDQRRQKTATNDSENGNE